MKGFGKILNYCENPLWIFFKEQPQSECKGENKALVPEKVWLLSNSETSFFPPAFYSEIARGFFFFFPQLPVGFSALNELVEMKKILTTPASSIKSRSN